MEELLGKARDILEGTKEWRSAEAYWFSHIESALGTARGSMLSMQDTLAALEDAAYGEDELAE